MKTMNPFDQEELDKKLFAAVSQHDLCAIDELISQGADPFAQVAPVELFVSRCAWSARLEKGCSAALAIQFPEVLDRLLPEKMTKWPVINQSADVFGLVSRCGSRVDLGHWAVELSSMESLKMIISRLDLPHPDAQCCLRRLTLSCLGGCSNTESKDNVLNALVLCMAAEPDLDCGWSHWMHFKIPSQTSDYQVVLLPMTFAMAFSANRNDIQWLYHKEALAALGWALKHDDRVREGERRMGSISGGTMMHMAASCSNIDVLRVAINAGCAIDAKDSLGFTALEFARNCGKHDSVAFIESWLAKQSIEQAMADHENKSEIEELSS